MTDTESTVTEDVNKSGRFVCKQAVYTNKFRKTISKLFIKHSMHTNQALISDLVVLVDQAITEAKREGHADFRKKLLQTYKINPKMVIALMNKNSLD